MDDLPADSTSAYWNLDLRIGWRPMPELEFSLVGQNLLERGVYAKATWRFGR